MRVFSGVSKESTSTNPKHIQAVFQSFLIFLNSGKIGFMSDDSDNFASGDFFPSEFLNGEQGTINA